MEIIKNWLLKNKYTKTKDYWNGMQNGELLDPQEINGMGTSSRRPQGSDYLYRIFVNGVRVV